MASTSDNPTVAESGSCHELSAAGSTAVANKSDNSSPQASAGDNRETLRQLIAEGENSPRAPDWAVYDFLDRMAEKRRNAGK